MKILLKNVGVFKQAEYEIGDLTIICGENNTGKTYATYCLYGFYDYWKNGFIISRPSSEIIKLMQTGSLIIPINDSITEINKILIDASRNYTKYLPNILGTQEKYFENTSFLISAEKKDVKIADTFKKSWRTPKSEIVQITKERGKKELSISLLIDSKDIESTSSFRGNLATTIGEALKEIIFGNTFSDIFIASAERTGAVIFKSDLNFEQTRLIKEIAGNPDANINELLNKIYSSGYALPVKRNIDFIRKLEEISKLKSFIYLDHPELLADFADIIGGEYKVGKEGLYYSPKSNKNIKLTMGESSSSVRSLLDIGFYLRHVAEKGDLLMIDEPELNLHPCNQRRLAKLFARLINIGIKVFITTHSDYIIKELNTLIMMNNRKDTEHVKRMMSVHNYKSSELISSEQVKVFISEKGPVLIDGNSKKSTIQTLIPADIDPFYGIEARSFDKTILEMNQIQESIILGR